MCGPNYPVDPPLVHFISRVNLSFVDPSNGQVLKSGIKCLSNWHRDSTMEMVLTEIRRFALIANLLVDFMLVGK